MFGHEVTRYTIIDILSSIFKFFLDRTFIFGILCVYDSAVLIS